MKQLPLKQSALRCEHETIENWTCKSCKTKMSQFECIFDDFNGKTGQNFRIIYENQFLQDFLNTQI